MKAVEFSMIVDGKCTLPVVAFSDIPLVHEGTNYPPIGHARSIKITQDAMPKTWHEGYKWDDLNIFSEAHTGKDYDGTIKFLGSRLYFCLCAFLNFNELPDHIYMTVWTERLKK